MPYSRSCLSFQEKNTFLFTKPQKVREVGHAVTCRGCTQVAFLYAV